MSVRRREFHLYFFVSIEWFEHISVRKQSAIGIWWFFSSTDNKRFIIKNLSEWFVNKSSIKIGDAIGFMRLWAILLNYMFVDATNQLTWRSHVHFKAFTHEKQDQKKKCNHMILLWRWYYSFWFRFIRLCSYRGWNFLRIWQQLSWV